MSVVTRLTLSHVRSHENITVKFSPHVTIITGQNGSGKTTILEAIYVALQGSSFRGFDQDILQIGSQWWRIEFDFKDYSTRTITYNNEQPASKKRFTIDDKTSARLPAKNRYPVVLFEPDDLRLLNGSPTRRRQFIDRFISQLDPLYNSVLRKYERALKQRNNLLKHPHASNDELFVWNIALSEYGAEIIEKRTLFIEQINQQLSEVYNTIAQSTDIISVHYSHTIIGDSKQKLLTELEQSIIRDRQLGNTSVGPHRHDVIFKFNNSLALSVASRGEIRTIILALKFLEVDIIEQITNIAPLILLDDVFSELDVARQTALSDTIRSHQIIITSTHVLSDSKAYKHILLKN